MNLEAKAVIAGEHEMKTGIEGIQARLQPEFRALYEAITREFMACDDERDVLASVSYQIGSLIDLMCSDYQNRETIIRQMIRSMEKGVDAAKKARNSAGPK